MIEYKYLGMEMSQNGCEKAKNEKLSLANQWVGRLGLNAPRYTAVEALRGDMDWSTFRERLIKSTLRYKIRIERMDDERMKVEVSVGRDG